MDDKKFDELKLRMTIVPGQARWPEPKYIHWEKLHAVADEARDRVAKAWAAMDEIDADRDLSSEGRDRKKKKLAAEVIADFQKSKALVGAKDAVERMVAKWAEQTGLAVKAPANIAEAVIQSEIRAHLVAVKGSKIDFLRTHATDPVVASAILGAPGFLSGLSEAEITMVRHRIDEHVAPEVAAARDATLKAMKEAEAGWQRAVDKIGERAGLTKGSDGTWRDPSMSEAA
jgi:hypothetical protein